MIDGGITDTVSVIGSLIAEPNQWTRYTGVIPLMAMAHMLQRTIVTLSADGITAITPHDFNSFIGFPDTQSPIAIYHCQAGAIQRAVPFGRRNHYVAVKLDDENSQRLRGTLLAIVNAQSGKSRRYLITTWTTTSYYLIHHP